MIDWNCTDISGVRSVLTERPGNGPNMQGNHCFDVTDIGRPVFGMPNGNISTDPNSPIEGGILIGKCTGLVSATSITVDVNPNWRTSVLATITALENAGLTG